MRVKLVKTFVAEVAHRVPGSTGPGAQLHGHSLRIDLVVEGEVEREVGWLIDYGDIKRRFLPLYERLDHHYVNEIEGMVDPSFAGIAAWIRERLAPELPGLSGVHVTAVGHNRYCPTYLEPDPVLDLPARLRFTFEAAQSLPQLPPTHPCHRLHGHSYRIEVGADELDRLEPRLKEVYDELDHRFLNDVAGLGGATSERLAQWMWTRLSRTITDLSVVVVQETDTARCIYRG